MIIQPQWGWAGPFNNFGLAQVDFVYAVSPGDTFNYNQVINQNGEYVVPHHSIVDLNMRVNGYISYISMEIQDSFIKVGDVEGGTNSMFDLKGNMIFASGNWFRLYSMQQYDYVLNRQVMRKHGRHGKFYFTDCFLNRKSPDFDHINPGEGFDVYRLYKLVGYNGEDSIELNPQGPAAWICKGNHYMLVDTQFNVLFKCNRRQRNKIDCNDSRHPKDIYSFAEKRRPYSLCRQMDARFDSLQRIKLAYFNWSGKQVTPYIYDYPGNYSVYRFLGCNIPYTLVKKDSFYSYIDTFGHLLMPFRYKNISHYNGHYGMAYDTAWHWISKEGVIISPYQYKNLVWFNGEYGEGYDTCWHFIDEYGKIVLEEFRRKGYKIVPNTRLSLLYDPKRKIYIDKYGREYFEP